MSEHVAERVIAENERLYKECVANQRPSATDELAAPANEAMRERAHHLYGQMMACFRQGGYFTARGQEDPFKCIISALAEQDAEARAGIVAWINAEAQREGNDDTAYTMRAVAAGIAARASKSAP